MQGWIKLHRKILLSNTFQNEKLLKVFIWCLLKATHTEYVQQVGMQKVRLMPGQFIYGRKQAATELRMKESTVRNYIQVLLNDKNIDIKTTNKFSIVTVANWEVYQSETENIDSKKDSKRTAKGQQKDTNKNDKNVNNNKRLYREYVYLTQREYDTLLNEYGEDITHDYIERLNDYIGQIGEKEGRKKYKSHYSTIRNWYRNDKAKKKLVNFPVYKDNYQDLTGKY